MGSTCKTSLVETCHKDHPPQAPHRLALVSELSEAVSDTDLRFVNLCNDFFLVRHYLYAIETFLFAALFSAF
jgi:hypothetical protein